MPPAAPLRWGIPRSSLSSMLSPDGKKLACEKCIKGHRSSSCKHSDRLLFEIKPKGRPQTQCDHCRELRKVKQVHVKCSCTKADASTASSSSANGVFRPSRWFALSANTVFSKSLLVPNVAPSRARPPNPWLAVCSLVLPGGLRSYLLLLRLW